MFIVRNRKIFFAISGIIAVFSLFSIFFFGLNLSIEFTGGSLLEVRYLGEKPSAAEISTELESFLGVKSLVQESGNSGFLIRMRELTIEEHKNILNMLSFEGVYAPTEDRYTLVGPSIGQELRSKAWFAIAAVLIAIILFVMFAFRSTSELRENSLGPPGWHYGVVAIIALAHDIVVPAGIFAFLGSTFISAEIDILFVTALLAILGYSVNDTIVVFDRVRENIKRNEEEKKRTPLTELIGKSLSETYARSINTSLTTLFVLTALIFLGGTSVAHFALVLAIGVIAGTYSSIFLAVPLLVAFSKSHKAP